MAAGFGFGPTPCSTSIGIVIVMTSFIRKRHEILDVRMILLSIALLFQTIADISFASVAAGQGLAEAQPIFWLFAAASLFYMATAIAVGRPLRQRHTAERSPSILPLLVPYGIAGVLLVTLIVRSVDTGLGPGRLVADGRCCRRRCADGRASDRRNPGSWCHRGVGEAGPYRIGLSRAAYVP